MYYSLLGQIRGMWRDTWLGER